MKKLNIFTLILSISISLFAGDTETDKVILRKNGDIQFEGATKNNFETTVDVVDPTADNAVLIQNGSGTLAFLTDIGGGSFQRSNTIWVDLGNGGSEDGTEVLPFNTIPEGLAASSVGDLIKIAPGTYAEALVFPHDVFVEGEGVEGLLSIDISSGSPDGLLGSIEYHSTGVTIHSDSDTVENGNLLIFAHATGSTTAAPFTINMLPGTYDLVAARLDLWIDTDARNNSFSGIGTPAAIITTTNTIAFKDFTTNSFQNLDIQNGASGVIFGISARINEVTTGSVKNVNASGQISVSSGASGQATGDHEHNNVFKWLATGLVKNESKMLDISAGDTIQITAGNTQPVDIWSCPSKIILSGVFDKSVTIRDANAKLTSLNLSVTYDGGLRGVGSVSVDTSTDTGNYDGGYMSNWVHETSIVSQRGAFLRNILENEFRIKYSTFFFLGGIGAEHTIIESDVEILYSTLRYTNGLANRDSGAVEFLGSYKHCNFLGAAGALGVSVSTGASIIDSVFTGFDSTINPAIRGRNLLLNYGDVVLKPIYVAATNELVYPLNKQPLESDGAGGRQVIADLTTFDATIYELNDQSSPTAGEELSNLEGLLAEMQTFEDVDTTPADGLSDTYGFATATGVSVFVLRTTATDSAIIDSLLSAPASNLESALESDEQNIGMAATITMKGVEMDGFVGQEITVTGNVRGTKSVTLIADDTVISMNGFDKLKLDSDNATATNRTMSFDLTSLVPDQIYVIYFLDNGFQAEWIDGGADGARLNATITFDDDNTAMFIYDGTDIRELASKAN